MKTISDRLPESSSSKEKRESPAKRLSHVPLPAPHINALTFRIGLFSHLKTHNKDPQEDHDTLPGVIAEDSFTSFTKYK